MIDLTGKVALVTGGSRAAGRAIALRLAEAGADVVLNYLGERNVVDHAAEQIAALGRRVAEVQADVSEPEDVQAMLHWVGETFGRLDIVVSYADDGEAGDLLGLAPERLTLAINHAARSLVLLVQAALPWLAHSPAARVIAVSGSESGQGVGGLEHTVASLAAKLDTQGVRVNGVQSASDPAVRRLNGQNGHSTDDATSYRELANAVLFLSSDLSTGLQGEMLSIRGLRASKAA
jgi:NAD(P)-dependent dehydrogenase (short-subunit alcohol dehydrogenase family)